MKVYIAKGCYDYEGCEILGVYIFEEKAKKFIKEYKRKTFGFFGFDNYECEEWKVNK